jgi:hypothetical protein
VACSPALTNTERRNAACPEGKTRIRLFEGIARDRCGDRAAAAAHLPPRRGAWRTRAGARAARGLGQVFRHGIAAGRCERNPVSDQPQGPAGGGATGGSTGLHPVDPVNFPFGAFLTDLVDGDGSKPDREICMRITAHIADNFPIRKVLP